MKFNKTKTGTPVVDPEAERLYGLFREFNPVAVLSRDIVFDCPCTLEHYVDAVKHLPKAELDDILAHDAEPIRITCHNCGSEYEITKDMLRN